MTHAAPWQAGTVAYPGVVSPGLQLVDLRRRSGDVVALDGVSFDVDEGQDPDSTVARIASLLPISSALAMPVRMVLGSAAVREIVASLVLVIGSTALPIPLAGRLYTGAILRIGAKVKLRDAWRAAA